MSKEAFFRVCRATNFRVCRATKGQELVLCYTVLHDTSIHILLQKISVWVCFKFYRVIYHCHIHNHYSHLRRTRSVTLRHHSCPSPSDIIIHTKVRHREMTAPLSRRKRIINTGKYANLGGGSLNMPCWRNRCCSRKKRSWACSLKCSWACSLQLEFLERQPGGKGPG